MEWVWYGHAGHFTCAQWCRYHPCTKVGRYLVSTVGEYWPERAEENIALKGDAFDNAYMKRFGFETMGASPHCYETMVFKLTQGKCESKDCGCGLPNVDYSEIEGQRSMTAGEASAFHMKMCKKWSTK